MTTAYKELAKEANLFGKIRSLDGVVLKGYTEFDVELGREVEYPPVDLKDDGIHGIVGRIVALTKRYEDTLLIPRDAFEEGKLFIEAEFKFDETLSNGDIFRFKGFMDLFGKLKPEFRDKYANGKSWVLRDYKTGKAKETEAHDTAADESLQLTLYFAALVREFDVPADDLDISLHYVDAAHNSGTEREVGDFEVLMPLAEAYVASKGNPGLPKRLLYSENMDCKYCEIKDECEKRFGFATKSAAARKASKEALKILNQMALEG
jgi:RecB family exonuclease